MRRTQATLAFPISLDFAPWISQDRLADRFGHSASFAVGLITIPFKMEHGNGN